MTEYELDKIKKSFVRSNAKCPVEVACLLTVIKYYNGKETDIHTLTEWCKINGKLTLAGMKQGAYIFRHESRNMFAKHSSINTKKTSHHPFHSQ